MSRIIKILATPDGQEIAENIRKYCAGLENVIVEDPQTEPGDAIKLVVCIITPQAFQDSAYHAALQQCRQLHLPMLPIVEDIATYAFNALPPELSALSTRNALGWKLSNPSISGEQRVFDTLDAWLGDSLFEHERTLFISYRREDGENVAKDLYDYFTKIGYRAFLDTEKIEGGVVVQRAIEDAIFDRDILLLVDSPQAQDSKWMQEEIDIAIKNRIKIVVLRLPGGKISLPQEIRVTNESAYGSFAKIELFIREAIRNTTLFDDKVKDALDFLHKDVGFHVSPHGSWKVLLAPKNAALASGNVLLEYEHAPHSLETLYRLNCDYEEYHLLNTPISSAFFVYAGPPLSSYQKEAVDWARQTRPLEVTTLDEFLSAILP